MRIAFECYAIYSAVICTLLTFALALALSDEKLEQLARKVINVSFIIYGPLMMVLCIVGARNMKALSTVCTI